MARTGRYATTLFLIVVAGLLGGTTCLDDRYNEQLAVTNDSGLTLDVVLFSDTYWKDWGQGYDDLSEYHAVSIGDLDPFGPFAWCWTCEMVDGRTRDTYVGLAPDETITVVGRLADTERIVFNETFTGRELKISNWKVRLVDQRFGNSATVE